MRFISQFLKWLSVISQPFNPPIPWRHFSSNEFVYEEEAMDYLMTGMRYRLSFDYKVDLEFTPKNLPLTMFTEDNGKSWDFRCDKMPVPFIEVDNVSLVRENKS